MNDATLMVLIGRRQIRDERGKGRREDAKEEGEVSQISGQGGRRDEVSSPLERGPGVPGAATSSIAEFPSSSSKRLHPFFTTAISAVAIAQPTTKKGGQEKSY